MSERDIARTEYRVNCDPEGIIPRIRNFCLDMDGTVYLDNLWIDGAKDFLAELTATGRKYCFMTNNSSKSASIYVEKLLNMGLVIDPEKQLITSGHATVDYLKRKYPGKRIYLFGNPMVDRRGASGYGGHQLLHEFPLQRPVQALRSGQGGTSLCGYTPGFQLPDEDRFYSGHRIAQRIGKPEAEIIEYAMRTMGAKPEESCVVGDRLYTDVKSGVNNGLYGIFVLSGEAQLKDLPDSDVKPHLIFDSVKEIIPYL